METQTLTVRGMQCDACVGHVARALRDLPGVADAQVSLEKQCATVVYDPRQVSVNDMRHAVEEEGYEAEDA